MKDRARSCWCCIAEPMVCAYWMRITTARILNLLVSYQLAAISQSALGFLVADASENRDAIIAALDLLVIGI